MESSSSYLRAFGAPADRPARQRGDDQRLGRYADTPSDAQVRGGLHQRATAQLTRQRHEPSALRLTPCRESIGPLRDIAFGPLLKRILDTLPST